MVKLSLEEVIADLLTVILHNQVGSAEVYEPSDHFFAAEQMLHHRHQSLLPFLSIYQILVPADERKSLTELLLSILFGHVLGELCEVAGI